MRADVLVECLKWAREVKLLSGPADDPSPPPERWSPEDWYAALRECLRIELSSSLSEEDFRYAWGLFELSRTAAWSNAEEWGRTMSAVHKAAAVPAPTPDEVVVDEVVIPGPRARCSPDDPLPDHIDHDDPSDAPPHGTIQRYSSSKYKCRCEHCRTAHTTYRRELRHMSREVRP